MTKWKAPGPDAVHGYWTKMLVSMQERIAFYLQSCITRDEVPDLMTTGQTVLLLKEKSLLLKEKSLLLKEKSLLLKEKSKGSKVYNYRQITCLPLKWKLLTGIAVDEIYNHIEENDLLQEEQKSCHRNSRGTKVQLLIDKAVMKNCRRKFGLRMVWIRIKAYDMVPHS